jgi:nitrile hydratase accessory protein
MSVDHVSQSPGIRRDQDGPVFRAPWEAHVFGLTVVLFERGCFTWKEWTEALTSEIAAARERGEKDGDGARYYEYWLAALEKVVAGKGLATVEAMSQRKQEWDRAARATPHGQPIVLPGL